MKHAAQPTLYLMLGYPGAGKTTTAKILHDLTGAKHLWADQSRREMFGDAKYSPEEHTTLYDYLNKRAELLLQEGTSVIYDTNFNYYKDRLSLRALAQENGAETILLWIQTPKITARERATDGANLQNTRVLGNMSADKFEQLTHNFEEPKADESYTAVDGTKITPDYIKQLLNL